MEERTTARPTGPAAGWWWGTNWPGGTFCAGRAHVVHPAQPASGLCGLPVDDVWERRPPMPEHLCPDCCVLAMATSYPPFPPSPAPPLPHRPESIGRPLPAPEAPAEKTTPLPAGQIHLNDLMVLPGRGELSSVIGVWPCSDQHTRLLYVCTANGDWAHRRTDSPLLRASIRSPAGRSQPTRRTSRQQVPGLEVLAPQCLHRQVKEDPPVNNERFTMTATLATETPTTPPPATEDPFALDVQIITDVPPGHPLAGCKGNTDDGCDPTCASACVTGGV
ncbi:FxLD family lanthipeptide [Frankia sp. CcWB3]